MVGNTQRHTVHTGDSVSICLVLFVKEKFVAVHLASISGGTCSTACKKAN